MDWILPLSESHLGCVHQVGGKAARLGEMLRAGFAVPDGFVTTIDAFGAHLTVHNPDERPEAPRLKAEFLAAVAAACDAHFAPDERFAVRSSALDEDGHGASFAGQHETYYFVTRESLPAAIVDCWLSLWSDAAVAYRARWEAPPQPMSVIVQRLLKAESAGVSFSRDPADPRDQRCVIEAVWGLGAALVDGRVSPDRYHVDRNGRVTQSLVGDKRVHIPGTLTDPHHSRLIAVSEQRRLMPVLSSVQARQIAVVTEQLEVLFEGPVDVEWAYEEDVLLLLQARPITSWLTQDVRDERLVLFQPVAENFSEPFTPMTEDLYARILPRIGRFVRGRLYLSFDLLKRMTPLKLTDAELTDLFLLKPSPTPALSLARLPLAALLFCGMYLANGVFWHRSARVTEQTLLPARDLIRRYRENPRMNALRTMRRLLMGRHPFQGMHHFLFQINISSGRYFVLLGLLNALLDRWAPAFDRTLLPSLSHGGNDMFSTRMVNGVSHLADIARRYGDCLDALASETPVQNLGKLDADHPFARAIDEFLREFGHRGGREIELAAPRWREDAAPLITMIRSHLKREDSGSDTAYAQHLVARDQLHQALGQRWKRRLIDRLISRIRHYIVLRENTRHYHTMIFDVVRHKLNAFENELIAAGKLHYEGDIYFLTFDEATDLAEGRQTPRDASLKVRERRMHWQNAARAAPPDRYNLPIANPPSGDTLRGVSVCPGTVTGTARVVLSPESALDLKPGDILVAPYTDPTWTPLFPGLGGIVVGIGSYLSHAGTIAREYQIPCVVDVNNCTQHIPHGSRVHLDATAGVVHVEHEE